MLNVTLPIYWVQEFKTKPDKTILVGLNHYRNAHYYIKNKMKQDFHELVSNQLKNAEPITGQYKVHTKLYYKNPSSDGRNIVPMIEKFLLDALQELDLVSNDNVKLDVGGSWEVVEQDKENPRCEIQIKETNG